MQHRAVRHLSEAVRIPTVSHMEETPERMRPFLEFHAWLAQAYPRVHATMAREQVQEYALLYRWPGRDPAAPAALLMAHMDVVPPGDAGEWPRPPFCGDVAEGFLHGRGALDMKGQLVAMLEACEDLLAQGFVPAQDIYLALGCDEELMRETSAAHAMRLLQSRGVRLSYVLDEGVALDGAALGVSRPVVALCVAEKGYLDLRLTARGAAGHASAPPETTALGELARALCAIAQNPMPRRIDGPGFVAALLAGLAALLPPGTEIPALLRANPRLDALTHTTIAPTMAQGAGQSNVLPERACAVLNIRLAPWDTLETVQAHIARVAPWVEQEVLLYNPPVPPANLEGTAYRHMLACAQAAFPEAAILPWCMTAATDSRFFAPLCRDILRITPFPHADAALMHAPGERLPLCDLPGAVRFFTLLLRG